MKILAKIIYGCFKLTKIVRLRAARDTIFVSIDFQCYAEVLNPALKLAILWAKWRVSKFSPGC